MKKSVLAKQKMNKHLPFYFGLNNIIKIQKSSKVNQLEENAML